MPRPLGPTDSFNSSSATIVPDVRRNANNVAGLPNARNLMPHDTLGGELSSMLDAADPNDWENQPSSQLSGYAGGSHTGMSQFINTDNTEYTTAMTDAVQFASTHNAPFHGLTQLNLDTSYQPPQLPAFPPAYPEPNFFRPSSSHSHRSSISSSHHESEYSYTSTELNSSEAEQMGLDLKASPGGLDWDMSQAYPTPGPSANGPSPTVPGSLTGSAPMHEDRMSKQQRLEHRRQINRKSAQKHRLRRRVELEDLNKTIAEKDARIAQLERDLAVEKAKTTQLNEFMNKQLAKRKSRDGDLKVAW